MSIKEKVLTALGLPLVTNQELLAYELSELSPKELLEWMTGDKLIYQLTAMQCEACKRIHGGGCSAAAGNGCALPLEDWLVRPCERDTLLL